LVAGFTAPDEVDVAEPVVFEVANLDGHVQLLAVFHVKKPGGPGRDCPEHVVDAGNVRERRAADRQKAWLLGELEPREDRRQRLGRRDESRCDPL
jgi:hypothetical protein